MADEYGEPLNDLEAVAGNGMGNVLLAAPLRSCVDEIRAGHHEESAFHFRDAMENVFRMAWIALVSDTIEAIRALREASLSHDDKRCATELLAKFTRGEWSAGAVRTYICGGKHESHLRRLTGLLQKAGRNLSPRLSSVLSADDSLAKDLGALVNWRNNSFAHGVRGALKDQPSGSECWAPRVLPIAALARVLRGLAGWLDAFGAAASGWQWPRQAGPQAWRNGARGAPHPVVMVVPSANGAGNIWFLESSERDKVVYRGLFDNSTKCLRLEDEALASFRLARMWVEDPVGMGMQASDSSWRQRRDRSFVQRIQERAVETPLVDRIAKSIAGPGSERRSERRVVWVLGPQGSGKSVLLQQLADRFRSPSGVDSRNGRRSVVFHFRLSSRAGDPGTNLVSDLIQVIEKGESSIVRPRDAHGRELHWPGGAGTFREYWERLAASNPDVRFLFLLDGAEELSALGDGLSVVPAAADGGELRTLEGFDVVLASRPAEELSSGLREALARVAGGSGGGTIHLEEYFATAEGAAALKDYLRSKHCRGLGERWIDQMVFDPKVRAERPLGDAILDRAGHRFLWVYHYARGLEVGFLSAGMKNGGLEAWPSPEDFYSRFLSWLEERYGGSEIYCGALRRVLFTYALSGMPINDATFDWLLDDGGAEQGAVEGTRWREFLTAARSHVDDFLETRTVSTARDTGVHLRAAYVVAPDGEGNPEALHVTGLAHDAVRGFLLGEALPEPWKVTRRELREHFAARVLEGVSSDTKDRPGPRAPQRFAEQRGAAIVAGLGKAGCLVEFARRLSARHGARYQTETVPGHWLSAFEDLVGALREARGAPEGQPVGTVGLWTSWALRDLSFELRRNLRAREAAMAAAEAVSLARAFPDLGVGASEREIQDAVKQRPDAVRNLAIGLGCLGEALWDLWRVGEAREAHEEAVRLKRALAGLGEGASEREFQEAVKQRPDAVRNLAIGLGRLGQALQTLWQAGEARKAHEEAVRLERALAGLGEGASTEKIQAAVEQRPDAVRNLAIGLGCLGQTLRDLRQADEARKAHEDEVALSRALAGLGEEPLEDGIQAAVNQRPDAVRNLANGLDGLGRALQALRQAGEAREAHDEGVRLSRALAGLGEPASTDEIQAAVAQRPDAVRNLTIGLGCLGGALLDLRQAGEAREAHKEEARLSRALAGLGEEASKEEIQAAAKQRPDAVRNLAIGLGCLGQALRDLRQAGEAREAHEEEVRLKRALAGLGKEASVWKIQAAVAQRPDAVRNLTIGLGCLGGALLDLRQAGEAREAHKEEARLSRALAGLGEEASKEEIQAAAKQRPDAVRNLAIGLGCLGQALQAPRQAGEAREAHEEEVRLSRALAGLGKEASVWKIQDAVKERPNAVRGLAIGLGCLGQALRDLRQAGEAREAHEEEVRLSRALAGLGEGASEEEIQEAVKQRPDAVRELAIGLACLSLAEIAGSLAAQTLAHLDESLSLYAALAARYPEDPAIADELAQLRDIRSLFR